MRQEFILIDLKDKHLSGERLSEVIEELQKSDKKSITFLYFDDDRETAPFKSYDIGVDNYSIIMVADDAPQTAKVMFALDLRDETVDRLALIKLLKSSKDIDCEFNFAGDGDFQLIESEFFNQSTSIEGPKIYALSDVWDNLTDDIKNNFFVPEEIENLLRILKTTTYSQILFAYIGKDTDYSTSDLDVPEGSIVMIGLDNHCSNFVINASFDTNLRDVVVSKESLILLLESIPDDCSINCHLDVEGEFFLQLIHLDDEKSTKEFPGHFTATYFNGRITAYDDDIDEKNNTVHVHLTIKDPFNDTFIEWAEKWSLSQLRFMFKKGLCFVPTDDIFKGWPCLD